MPLTFSPPGTDVARETDAAPAASPGPATHTPPAARLTADFYDFQALLTERERVELGRIRTFLETEVAPRADEFWERAESPRHLFPLLNGLAETGGRYGLETMRVGGGQGMAMVVERL